MNKKFNIEDNVIKNYYGNEAILIIPDGVKDIFYELFENNHNITSVIIPGTIKNLTSFTFSNCINIKEVKLNEGVKCIECGAFKGCISLEKAILPKSLTCIQKIVFEDCKSLHTIYFTGTKQEWENIEKQSDWDKNTGKYTIVYSYNK